MPEVDFDGIEETRVPGHGITFTDLRPKPRGLETDCADSIPSTSGAESPPYRVTGKLRVGEELIRTIEKYGNVTSEAVKRDMAGGLRTAARVVFHLSHVSRHPNALYLSPCLQVAPVALHEALYTMMEV